MAKVQLQTPASSNTPSTQNVNKVQSFLSPEAVRMILIVVGVLMALGLIVRISTWGYALYKKNNSSASTSTAKEEKGGGFINIHFGGGDKTPKAKQVEEVRLELSDTTWSDPVRVPIGKRFNYNHEGKMAVLVNRTGRVFEHVCKDGVNVIYPLDKNFRRIPMMENGKPVVKNGKTVFLTAKSCGSNVAEIQFMSLEQKGLLLTGEITK